MLKNEALKKNKEAFSYCGTFLLPLLVFDGPFGVYCHEFYPKILFFAH